MAERQAKTSFYFYTSSYIFGIISLLSIHYQGLYLYLSTITAFGIIPILELILPPNRNFYRVKQPLLNNVLIVGLVPFHFYIFYEFLELIVSQPLSTSEYIGAVLTMGLQCGVYGINVAHELGHRKQKHYQYLAQVLLLSSLYQHFFIEHNRGHHKLVGTPNDPATARKDETLYRFWIRSITQGFRSAFHLEKKRLQQSSLPVFSVHNLFLRFMVLEFVALMAVFLLWGTTGLIFFLLCAGIGILLLESINYVEHYGLQRKEIANGVYEQANATHSWNSDHVLGRSLLFELSRHSHHHQNMSRAYYELESMDNARQLPTGYPGSVILALIPPLFFKVMNPRLN